MTQYLRDNICSNFTELRNEAFQKYYLTQKQHILEKNNSDDAKLDEIKKYMTNNIFPWMMRDFYSEQSVQFLF